MQVQVSSKRVAGQLVCFGDNNFEWPTTVKRLHRNVKTFSADSSAIFANNSVSAITSYCPQNKPADLPLFYWRPVHIFEAVISSPRFCIAQDLFLGAGILDILNSIRPCGSDELICVGGFI